MTWKILGPEGGWATVPANSTVRYGDSPDGVFIDRVLSGTFVITNITFGRDPTPAGVPTFAWLWEGQGQPPAPPPAPPPVDPAPPPETPDGLPALTDPAFERKMATLNYRQRLKEHEQGERSIAQTAASERAMVQLATVQQRILNEGIPSDVELVRAVDRLTALIGQIGGAPTPAQG